MVDEWATDLDADAAGSFADLMVLHAQICDHIKTAHSAVQEWNNADDDRKQEMESKLGEQFKELLEEFFEGATSSLVVAGTALVAGVSILAF